MADRVIFHCDLNCFFASVELLDKPALREVPVTVRRSRLPPRHHPGQERARQAQGRPGHGGDGVAGQAEVSEPDPAAAPTSQSVFTTNRLLATFIKYKTQTN